MAFTISDATANAIIDAMAGMVNGGTIEVRSGAKPASVADAATGTLLATLTLPNPAYAAAAARSASLNTVAAVTAVADGVAGWCRVYTSAAAAAFDGTAGATGSGEDMELNTTTVTTGSDVEITSGTLTA